MRRVTLVVLALVISSLLFAWLLFTDIFSDPVIFLRIDAGLVMLIVGFVIAVLGISTLWVQSFGERTGQRRAELGQELRTASERHQFYRRLDHELKNPLTAIRAAIANLVDMPRDPLDRVALTTVESQTLRLSQLMSTLRKLSELETRPIERSPIDLGEILREVMTLADDNSSREQRHLTLALPPAPGALPQIFGDRDLLVLSIHNLVDNALKFSQPGDKIVVRAFEEGAMVALQVADTGSGIKEDDLPHVGEELFRGQNAYGVPGSGLGLALVHAIIERHGGHLSLQSREGQGTVATLYLPR